MGDITPPIPTCAIILLTALFTYTAPTIKLPGTLSYVNSFKTVGSDPQTIELLRRADNARTNLSVGLTSNNPQGAIAAGEAYVPCVKCIQISCETQPEDAKLDKALSFSWGGGLEPDEPKGKEKSCEVLMYDVKWKRS